MAKNDETQPSWGVISTSRVTGEGQRLFDSELEHHSSVYLRITAATRERDLGKNWIHGGRQYIEVAMSSAQWAEMVSNMNCLPGTPCTIKWLHGVGEVAAPTSEESEHDQHAAVVQKIGTRIEEHLLEAIQQVRSLRDKKSVTKAELLSLQGELGSVLTDLRSNMPFYVKSLREAMATVVSSAKIDIEAYAQQAANRVTLSAGNTPVLQLTEGDDGE